MTLKELVNRIKVVAKRTAAGQIRPLLTDTSVLIELILPRCLDAVTEAIARTPDGLNSLRSGIAIAFVSGVGTLPSSIKEEHLELLTFTDDLTCSWVPSWMEFMTHPSPNAVPMDYSRYTVKDGLIYYHQRGGVKGTFNGNRTVLAISRLVLPTLESDQVTIKDYHLNQLIAYAASVVNGQTPLTEIGLDYAALEQVAKKAESSD